jgi:hypothetical protein
MRKLTLRAWLLVVLLAVSFSPLTGTARAPQGTPQASFDKGQSLATQTLAEQQAPDGVALLADRPPLGIVIAEGDSWFAYPGLDVIGALKGQTLPNRDYYKVYSAANPGDTVESMAYDQAQREDFADEFRKVVDARGQADVKAVLLSGGGNDIAGKEFHMLLNHAQSSIGTPVDAAVADAFIDRIGRSLESLIGSAVTFADQILGRPKVRILVHGYANPVPDGRGFWIGWPFPGPWLEPGFLSKGYPNVDAAALRRNTDVMADLIARFNKRVAQIPARLQGRADVRYVDLTKVLNNTLGNNAYRGDWSNELHPTDEAFKRVAAELHRAIQQ